MGAMKAAVGDAVVTFLWILCVSAVGVVMSVIESALRIDSAAVSLLITTTVIFLLILAFGSISHPLGGACFNPSTTAAVCLVGFGGDDTRTSLLSMALRLPAQAAGAAGGALAIEQLMPPRYKHMLGGPSLKVDAHTGAAAEGVLTFLITFSCFWVHLEGPARRVVQAWLISVLTVVLVVAGAGYTGPAMNPANAFGWAYVDGRHNTWEHLYVYWVCPVLGATLAAWCFRVLFPQAQKDEVEKLVGRKQFMHDEERCRRRH